MKIYEVLDPRNGALYNVEMLCEIRRDDRPRFDIIEQSMVCPCCQTKSIELVVAIGMPSFFKTDVEAHNTTCEYYGKKMSERELLDLQKKNDRNLMIHNERFLEIMNKKTPKMDEEFIYSEAKHLERKLNKYDFNTPKTFYGIASVKYLGENEFGINNFTCTFRNSDTTINLGIGKKCSELMPADQLQLLKDGRRVKIVLNSSIKRISRFNNISITKTKCILVQEQR